MIETCVHFFDTFLRLANLFIKSVEELVLIQSVPMRVSCLSCRWVDRLGNDCCGPCQRWITGLCLVKRLLAVLMVPGIADLISMLASKVGRRGGTSFYAQVLISLPVALCLDLLLGLQMRIRARGHGPAIGWAYRDDGLCDRVLALVDHLHYGNRWL